MLQWEVRLAKRQCTPDRNSCMAQQPGFTCTEIACTECGVISSVWPHSGRAGLPQTICKHGYHSATIFPDTRIITTGSTVPPQPRHKTCNLQAWLPLSDPIPRHTHSQSRGKCSPQSYQDTSVLTQIAIYTHMPTTQHSKLQTHTLSLLANLVPNSHAVSPHSSCR